jgi:TonB family protein
MAHRPGSMSAATELWKTWAGQVADGKFPLRQWLGESKHSAVFLTDNPLTEKTLAENALIENRNGKSRKAAIKLILADGAQPKRSSLDPNAQFARWAEASKLSHPHLLPLLAWGRCHIDRIPLLYVVMEYAEENLGEILPSRPLSSEEARAMLRPSAEALAYLHQAGWVHGHIKPSNILAAGNTLKISTDGVGKIGERVELRGAYDAPEVADLGLSPAADVWSLGSTLLAVLTQREPAPNTNLAVVIPETIPHFFREIAQQCLQVDPQRRCSMSNILRRLELPESQAIGSQLVKTGKEQARPIRWLAGTIAAAALVLVALITGRFMGPPLRPAAGETHSAPSPQQDTPKPQSPAPFSEKAKPAPSSLVRGSVLHQAMPEVSTNALHTIQGTVRVTVDVSVDDSGNVSQAKLKSAGPSKYFAEHALAAARRWKFNPPHLDGKASASQWMLRFQFRRSLVQVFSTEINP